MSNTEVPAGWYPNPESPLTERFWDGGQWSAQTRPVAPSAAPAPPPPGPIPAVGQMIVVEKRSGTWWKVLLVLGVLFTLMLGGCIALIGGAANEVGIAIDEAVDQRASDEALVEASATITACGIDRLNRAQATIEFENPFDEEKGLFSIEVSFLDPDGVLVGSGTVLFENLAAGQKAIGEAVGFDLANGTAEVSCEITDAGFL